MNTNAPEKQSVNRPSESLEDRFGLSPLDTHHRIQVSSGLEFIEKIDWKRHKKVADIGAGPGHHAKVISTFGVEVICIDYVEPVYETLKRVKPEDAQTGFDAVWSHHCLEHIPNPIGALVQWNKLLSPGGSLYLTVPQVDYVMSSGHINAYTLPMLCYHLACAGFDCRAKAFVRSRSHLRASVIKSKTYDPSEEMVTELSSLVKKGLFSPSITSAIEKTGRSTAEDMHLDWFGKRAIPRRDSLSSVNFVTDSIWITN